MILPLGEAEFAGRSLLASKEDDLLDFDVFGFCFGYDSRSSYDGSHGVYHQMVHQGIEGPRYFFQYQKIKVCDESIHCGSRL